LVDGGLVEGKPAWKRNFGVVFQSYALFPHMRVVDNVGFPLKMRRHGRAEVRSRVDEALEIVRLTGLGDRLPRQLSGGQQQRVALARAIVARPRLLLMDEPLSALDKQLREHMQLELKEIQRHLGVTVVYVTHDQSEALVMSDRIAVMRNGRIEQVGTPRDIYDRPATRYVAEFIGESNFLDGVVERVVDGVATFRCGALSIAARCPSDIRAGEPATLALRPENIRLHGGVSGRVEQAIYVGDALKVRVRLDAGPTLSVKLGRDAAVERLAPGDPVELGWESGDSTLLAAS
jgi:ABC-type Fe3+/spermidine/putrescine transport system ATPase subunit